MKGGIYVCIDDALNDTILYSHAIEWSTYSNKFKKNSVIEHYLSSWDETKMMIATLIYMQHQDKNNELIVGITSVSN